MPLQIIRDDITRVNCDAIVNAANRKLRGGGGVDGAIHKAAGPGLHEECLTLGGCQVGHAKITKGYHLPCKYIIHTVGPHWFNGKQGEPEQLASCYRESLNLAKEYGCESVAFPLISTGVFGYPKDKALQVAINEISQFLFENDMLVYIVVYDKAAFQVSKKLIKNITEYIDECYVKAHSVERRRDITPYPFEDFHEAAILSQNAPMAAPGGQHKQQSLDELLGTMDESFSQMLLRKIDEKGMSDSECYKKANIDRKLFSKIRSDVHYKPSKATVLAFAIALELPLEEVKDMLMKAGFALSHSNKFDIIIEYFIKNQNYNVFEINEALFAFDQTLLGV